MSNTLAFLFGFILATFIVVVISASSRSSANVAQQYQPWACEGVIGN